nr:putative ribonuclease H-like domain-containing protein [Tanacetum cinerariifolium]
MKASVTLLMVLPNKDQLKFHSYQDAKLLMESIEKMYGGNKESKKVQMTLLKQQYENFSASRSSNINQNPQNMDFVSSNSTSSTNKADTAASGVSTTHTQGTTVNSTSVENLSDAVMCAFLVSQPKSPQLAKEDLEQIDPDDLEEMDLHWEMAMLTIRARRFMKKNRAPKNQDNRGREYERKTVPVETSTENALIAQDGIGEYDWSYQAKEKIPTNYAFMSLTSLESSSSSESEVDSCSESCMKAYANIKEQYDSLTLDYKKYQYNLLSYKEGLQSVEERIVHYKKIEVVLKDKINVLNLEVELRDKVLAEYTKNLEKAKKEIDELKLTLEKLQNSSKALNNLLDSQVSDKSKAGLGYKEITPDNFVNSSEILEKQENRLDKEYHAVPLPFTGNYMPPKHDLRLIDEYFKSVSVDVISNIAPSDVKTIAVNHKSVFSTEEPKPVMKNNFSLPIIKDWHSDDEINIAGLKSTVNHPRLKSKAYKRGHSQDTRPNNKFSANKNSIFNKKVNTIRVNNSTAKDRAVESGNMRREDNDVKAQHAGATHSRRSIKKKGVIDSGCSTHMTRNKFYLTGFEAYDGGFVSFGDGKEEVNNACYVVNRALVTKPHNKTPYELIRGRPPLIDFIKPFRCHVTILNTMNNLGNGPDWLFDIDSLTISMNYVPVVAGNQTNGIAGFKENLVAGQDNKKKELKQEYILIHICTTGPLLSQGSNDSIMDTGKKAPEVDKTALNNGGKMIKSQEVMLKAYLNKQGRLKTLTTLIVLILTNAFEEHSFERFSPFKNAFYLPHVLIVTLINDTGIFGNAYDDEEIGTKWVYKNKKDERGILIKNKARLVAQGHTQKEGIDYDEVFVPVARIEVIRLFLAYASFKDFIVYQMNVKSSFLYGGIEEEVYSCQPPCFEDPNFPDKVYKVEKALYGLHRAPRAWYETLSTYLLDNGFHKGQIDKMLFIKRHKDDFLLVQVYVDDIIFGSTKKELSTEFEKLMHDKFQMISMGELSFFLGLQVKQKSDGIFISQDKYVAEVLNKFDFVNVKTSSTPMKFNKPLIKDEEAEDVDVHLYGSMIGSLMYLTASRPHITFAVCACASLDKKSTTGVCQFLGKRLISWQCKNQTIVANSTTEAEYVAAANCCGQVLWIQNQMLDYGFNLMNTKIYIDNESTICIVKNPVFHSRTQHIEIRHHFIRDSYEKNLIQVIKIHTDKNAADLLTKAFDVSRAKISQSSGPTKLVADETVHKEMKDIMATAKVKKINDQEQIQALVDKKNVIITEDSIRSDLRNDAEGTACLLNEAIFKGLASMGRKQRKEAEVSHDESEDKDHVLTPSSDPLPSVEDSSILNELMVFCTSIQEHRKSRSEGLRRLKKIGSGRRVKSPMEKDSLGAQEDASKHERIIEKINQNAEIALDDETQGRTYDDEIFGVDDLAGEVVMETTTSVKYSAAPTTDVTDDEVIMAQALAALKSTKPKVVDKGKDKMIEPEVPIKRKEQMRIDEEYARKLEA